MISRFKMLSRRITYPLIIIALCFLLAFACKSVVSVDDSGNLVLGQMPEPPVPDNAPAKHDFKFVNAEVTAQTNIHYTGKYCNECHDQAPVEGGGNPRLKFKGDYKQLCRCHEISTQAYIHPVDIVPTDGKKERMAPDFPLENGQLTCLTCHDIYRQCRKRLFDRYSLRGAPYARRTDFCYQCHVRQNYEMLNPHHQISESGELILENCLTCHLEKPDEKHATFKDVTFIGNIELMCRRCHHIAGNHSGNADHMGLMPSADGLKRIRRMEDKYNIRLPLDEKGKMTCITCHNPHEKGVIPDDNPGSKGADSKYRHRLPENLCKECHQM